MFALLDQQIRNFHRAERQNQVWACCIDNYTVVNAQKANNLSEECHTDTVNNNSDEDLQLNHRAESRPFSALLFLMYLNGHSHCCWTYKSTTYNALRCLCGDTEHKHSYWCKSTQYCTSIISKICQVKKKKKKKEVKHIFMYIKSILINLHWNMAFEKLNWKTLQHCAMKFFM